MSTYVIQYRYPPLSTKKLDHFKGSSACPNSKSHDEGEASSVQVLDPMQALFLGSVEITEDDSMYENDDEEDSEGELFLGSVQVEDNAIDQGIIQAMENLISLVEIQGVDNYVEQNTLGEIETLIIDPEVIQVTENLVSFFNFQPTSTSLFSSFLFPHFCFDSL